MTLELFLKSLKQFKTHLVFREDPDQRQAQLVKVVDLGEWGACDQLAIGSLHQGASDKAKCRHQNENC
jgi:hypothetical protein